MTNQWKVVEPYHGLHDAQLDKVFGVVLSLAAEVWVTKDRLHLIEAALAEKGIVLGDRIDELARNHQRIPELERERDAFMERVLCAVSMRLKT